MVRVSFARAVVSESGRRSGFMEIVLVVVVMVMMMNVVIFIFVIVLVMSRSRHDGGCGGGFFHFEFLGRRSVHPPGVTFGVQLFAFGMFFGRIGRTAAAAAAANRRVALLLLLQCQSQSLFRLLLLKVMRLRRLLMTGRPCSGCCIARSVAGCAAARSGVMMMFEATVQLLAHSLAGFVAHLLLLTVVIATNKRQSDNIFQGQRVGQHVGRRLENGQLERKRKRWRPCQKRQLAAGRRRREEKKGDKLSVTFPSLIGAGFVRRSGPSQWGHCRPFSTGLRQV